MQPDSPKSRLTQHQQVREEAAQQTRAGTEFAQVEDLLRADRAQTPPPEELESRLQQSVAREAPPPPPLPWWKRWWTGL
jgi:hypothetical protein